MENVDYTKMIQPFVLSGVTLTHETLRRGAYGTVFKARYHTDCAAKEVHAILVDSMPQQEVKCIKDHFLRMSYLLSKCRHPNVLQFIGIFYSNPSVSIPTLVTELTKCSLRELYENATHRLPLRFVSALSILHDVSLGVWYLHSRNPPIMHCDLTPNNILIKDNSLMAKIGGFGAAIEGTKGDVMAPGSVPFMPPEALISTPHFSLSLDVFGYGGVALYAVTGEWPEPSYPQRGAMVLSEVQRRLQYLDKMIGDTEVLRPLVEECLNNDPARRPTIEVVAERIKEMKPNKDEIKVELPYASPQEKLVVMFYCSQMQKQ